MRSLVYVVFLFLFYVSASVLAKSLNVPSIQCHLDCRGTLGECIFREEITFDEFLDCLDLADECKKECVRVHGPHGVQSGGESRPGIPPTGRRGGMVADVSREGDGESASHELPRGSQALRSRSSLFRMGRGGGLRDL